MWQPQRRAYYRGVVTRRRYEETIRATHAHYFKSFDELVDLAAAS
jgi:hypothetical protein